MNKFKNEIIKIKKLLENKKQKILIVPHQNPDGDAIGACLAMYQMLVNDGFIVNIVSPNALTNNLKFLPNASEIIDYEKDTKLAKNIIADADFMFYFDFNDYNRVSQISKLLKTNEKAKRIVIDHHPLVDNFADIYIASTFVSSASELAYELITAVFGKNKLDNKTAKCLYAGIISDTINFTVNTQKRTLNIIAELYDFEVEKDEVQKYLFNSYSLDRMQLIGYALSNKLIILKNKKTAYISLNKQELMHYKYKNGDTEGLVNLPLSIENVEVSVLIIERSKDIKLSFRARNDFDVNIFAKKYFNGGGHKRAAGGTMKNITIEDVCRNLEKWIN